MPNYFRISLAVISVYILIAYFGEQYIQGGLQRSVRQATSGSNQPANTCIGSYFAHTFDEGPGDFTAQILQAFDQRNVKATFHILTARLKSPGYGSVIKNAYSNGHLIGLRYPIHAKSPLLLDDNEFVAILLSESYDFHQVLSVYPRFLRLPWGQFNETTVKLARTMGFVVSTWNLDPLDYQSSASNVESFIRNATSSKPTAPQIALYRDIYQIYNDVNFVGRLIDYSNSISKRAVSLDVCLGETQQRYRDKNVDGRLIVISVNPLSALPKPTGNSGSNSVTDGGTSTSMAISHLGGPDRIWSILPVLVAIFNML